MPCLASQQEALTAGHDHFGAYGPDKWSSKHYGCPYNEGPLYEAWFKGWTGAAQGIPRRALLKDLSQTTRPSP